MLAKIRHFQLRARHVANRVALIRIARKGEVRLTANIRADLHMTLRMRTVMECTIVGDLIEAWIESWK